jgi:FXSXX-COOH protein
MTTLLDETANLDTEIADLRGASLAALSGAGDPGLATTLRRIRALSRDTRPVPVAAFQSSL